MIKKKNNQRVRPLEQMIETESRFIVEAESVVFESSNQVHEEVFTRKFLSIEIDAKIAVKWPDAKIIARKTLSKDEIRQFLSTTLSMSC